MTAHDGKRPLAARAYHWACQRLYYELAPVYDGVAWLVSAGQWSRWRRLVLDYVDGPKVLEIGFGTGVLLLEMERRGWQPVGVELSPRMHTVAARRLRKASAVAPRVRARAQALPLPAGQFDAVVSTFPANYIFDPQCHDECARVLRPGGCFALTGLCVTLNQPVLARVAPLFYGPLPDALLVRLGDALSAAGLRPHVERRRVGQAEIPILIGQKAA